MINSTEFYLLAEFFDIYDLRILRQTCKYFKKNIKSKAKLHIHLNNPNFGVKLVNIFNNITFDVDNYNDAYKLLKNKISSLNLSKYKFEKNQFMDLTHFDFPKLTKLNCYNIELDNKWIHSKLKYLRISEINVMNFDFGLLQELETFIISRCNIPYDNLIKLINNIFLS